MVDNINILITILIIYLAPVVALFVLIILLIINEIAYRRCLRGLMKPDSYKAKLASWKKSTSKAN